MTFSELSQNSQQQTRNHERHVLQTIQEIIDLHFDLFRHRGGFEFSEDNQLQQVWLGLTTSAFHSLRISLQALGSGYYAQSFTLTRAAFEDWLTAVDCKSHTETVQALLNSEIRTPRPETMGRRLPDELKSLWRGVDDPEGYYGFMSTFAHPRKRALEATVNESGTFLIVPEYIEMRFALAALELLKVALLMLEFLERLADYLATPASLGWKSQHLEKVQPNGIALLESLLNRCKTYASAG